ncbi:MAG: DUF3098 domain-containing protein [Chitinophagaceae bacterium]|nr:DUF3098 domain-containing protein [Chitinophagaceae bacterium]MCW5906088.1 DUF3098 domain-containing protein [Chitinophagaceae bacterium]
MKSTVKKTAESQTLNTTPLFNKENYMWMLIGAALIIIGMLLMSGGKNQDPNVFDDNVVYAAKRITVAPILILVGFVVEIYAIFKKSTTVA